MRKFFSKSGFALNISAAILLLLAYAAPLVPPDFFWPLAFFGLAHLYLVFVNLLFLIVWVLLRSRKFLLPLCILMIGYPDLRNSIQLIPRSGSEETGIEVLSYNVHGFRSELRSRKTNSPRILEYFRSEGAAIICLQEATQIKTGKLSPGGINEALPQINYYHVASAGSSSDLVTFSKYPIINKGEMTFIASPVLVLYSDIKISDHQTIRVYNCHLQSYSIDPDDYSTIDSIGSASGRQHIKEARKISYKLRNGFRLRAYQARKLAEHIGKSPYPVVVCGDFNDTPVSYAYRKVRGELKDAFVESGWGISNTFNGDLPSFRIDYILYDQRLSAWNYQRDRVPYSDHFPVHCRINHIK